jgi:hypothetical protein
VISIPEIAASTAAARAPSCTMNMDRAKDSQLHDHASVLSTGIHVLPACWLLWRRILGETGKHDRRTIRKPGHQ